MQSTGQTSTQLASLVPMHGSVITYVIRYPSTANLAALVPLASLKECIRRRWAASAHASAVVTALSARSDAMLGSTSTHSVQSPAESFGPRIEAVVEGCAA